MDKKTPRSNRKNTSKNRGVKNAGFMAIVVLFALIIFAAYNQPSTLKDIPFTQALAEAN